MKIDLNNIKLSGKFEDSFNFEYRAENSLLLLESAEFSEPVKVKGGVKICEDYVLACGSVEYTVTGECTRCLGFAKKTFIAEFEEKFKKVEDDESYFYLNEIIDLQKLTDDTIILSFPIAFLCKEECKGICLSCGRNLNGKDNCNDYCEYCKGE